ncbi:Cilia- and flagella-associated protein 300 [Geodia barretti]|uniref:Cilia- and flagella-associated protein 300 n=1 Tax=Geodia barretti TaxID=519541 RepID=A0AA35RYU9_GEOBA|nr:Cilia- and flagella-associated protein 300 [Geodia barretti]
MGEEERFEFHQLPRDVESEVRAQAKDTAELFEKWGLSGRMKFATFLYNSHFQSYQKDSFTLDFFQSPVVNSVLTMPSSSGHPAPLSMASAVTSVEVDQVPCTLLSMNFFDRLKSSGIITMIFVCSSQTLTILYYITHRNSTREWSHSQVFR